MTDTPKWDITFVTRITGIRTTEPLGSGIRVADNILISDDKQVMRDILSHPQVRMAIGALEGDFLLNAPLFAWAQLRNIDPSPSHTPVFDLIFEFNAVLDFLINALWFIRDNAGDADLVFAIVYCNGTHLATHSNSVAHRSSTADLDFPETLYAPQEIRKARELLSHFMSGKFGDFGIKTGHKPIFSSKAPRLTRAWYILQAARTAPDHAIRTMFYISCLETLFSTDSTELQHKMAERTAVLLEDDPATRYLTYRAIARAYGVRSKTVHGSGVKESEDLSEINKTIDGLLRRAFLKLLDNDSLLKEYSRFTNEELNDYFLRRILGVKSTQ